MSFSVVIPTLWLPHGFERQLLALAAHPLVTEVLIINNRTAATPDWAVLADPKIRLLDQVANIYVNPAWNLGVAQAQCERVCLLNDDINFDLTVFDFLLDKVSAERGIYGLNMMDESGTLSLTPVVERCWGFGCLMVFHRDSYLPIPHALKILYGDDYLFSRNRGRGRENFVINGVANDREVSTTMSSDLVAKTAEFKSLRKTETHYWDQINPPGFFNIPAYLKRGWRRWMSRLRRLRAVFSGNLR
jgi:hypothetical protein